MESLWRKQTGELTPEKRKEAVSGKRHWDVIVVGAGMAGLLIAYYLQTEGMEVLVLEADRIASGQTERTTAKVTSQHGLKYSQLIEKTGVDEARMYARANEAAIREYERLIRENGIDCRFEKASAYLYTLEDETLLEKEAQAAAFLGIDASFTRETELPFEVKGAVCFRRQAQFEPLSFIRHIASKLEVWEQTMVKSVRENRVITETEELTAEKIVIATHYPVLNVPGFYFLRQHQERSYVMALSGCAPIRGMYYGIDNGGLSFRQAGEYLLLGGSACRTGQNREGGAYGRLALAAEQYFPDAVEELRWAAQDCMPHDGIPFIGKYSMLTPGLYVATGFQKWGMTTAMAAAMILRDELSGEKSPYREVFSPQRLHFRAGIGNLLTDIGVSVKGLGKGLYKRPRCSHMGCELVWNPEEKSFDCPCHGSRFDTKGRLLDNPAKKCVGEGIRLPK